MEDKTKILIVEDEVIINKTYAEELRYEGFEVFTSKNGKDGLKIALSKKPDLILLDILMPIMDGLTMMDKLRKENVYGKRVPIVLLSNLSPQEEKIMKCITNTNSEPTYYFVKSDWDLADVLEKIKEILKTNKSKKSKKIKTK
jgi:two-component system alkaline phosphatase synthesis response regulator PhoP